MDGLRKFRSLAIQDFPKTLSSRLHAVLSILKGFEQAGDVKGRTILDNLHIVRLIIEPVDSEER